MKHLNKNSEFTIIRTKNLNVSMPPSMPRAETNLYSLMMRNFDAARTNEKVLSPNEMREMVPHEPVSALMANTRCI